MYTPYKWGCVETRRGSRGGEKPARASAGIACPPTTSHCQPALSVCHFCQCLHIFTTHGWTCGQYIELFCMLFNFFMMSSSMYSPKLIFSHTHTHNLLFLNFIHVTLATHCALLHSTPLCEHDTFHSFSFGAPGKLFPFCCCYKEHCYKHSQVGLPMWDFSRALLPQIC